ncbi:MAG TPA: hypothetical protein VKY59_20450 [Spirillospora sp.]|nr:hypothetical protein [Spirillospora sp.]
MAQNVRTTVQETHLPDRDREVVIGYEERTSLIPVRLRRISWGAIVAGIALAITIQIALQLLGLSIGVNTINPLTEETAVDSSLLTGAVLWIGASMLISLFLGGWVAGYLANIPDNLDGIIHGLVVWAVVMVASLWLLTSSAISMITGMTTALGNVITVAGQGALAVAQDENVAPGVVNTLRSIAPELSRALGDEATALQAMDNELFALTTPSSAPATTEEQADDAAPNTANTTQQVSSRAAEEIRGAVLRIAALDTVDEADRQAVVDLIAARTSLSQEEAAEALNRWETAVRDVRAQITQTVEVVGQRVADTIAAMAGMLFLAMVLGAFAAGAGGLVGSPQLPEPRETQVAV